jgi:predicted aspartyl protease
MRRSGCGVIRYTPGQPILVSVKLNNRTTVRLMLDTGADSSSIRSSLLTAAGVDLSQPTSRGSAVMANGTTLSMAYFNVFVEAAGHSALLPHVGALDTTANEDGLLGRDFLDQFKMTLDPVSGIVTLVPR